jgi:hypothetical protein
MKFGYARVSTKDQAVALQVDALKKADCTKVHAEVTSGARSDRPLLAEADVAYDVWWIGLLDGAANDIKVGDIRRGVGHLAPPRHAQPIYHRLSLVGTSSARRSLPHEQVGMRRSP